MKKKVRIKVLILLIGLIASSFIIQIRASEEYHVTTTLQSPDPDSNYMFGSCIAVSDEYIAVGGHGDVYLYDSQGELLHIINSPQTIADSNFGASLALAEGILVIGDPYSTSGDMRSCGKSYIYDTNGNLLTDLQSPNTLPLRYFGWSVDICEDSVIISEPGQDVDEVQDAGKVYRYDLNGNLLTTYQSKEPCTGANIAHGRGNFGFSVAGDDGILVVGEHHTNIGDLNQAGRAQVFGFNGELLVTLQSPEPQTLGKFGYSVAINGNTIVVSESFAEVDGKSRAGKVYVFNTDGILFHTLQASEPEEGAGFGISVAVNEDTIVIGENNADVLEMNEGKAYVFDLEGNIRATIQSPEPGITADFGYSVAVMKEKIIIGERGATVDGKGKAGKAHIFTAGSPEFSFTNLKVPDTASKGETATITVDCSNTGTISGSADICLHIDGEMIEEKTVTVDAGQTKTVSFTYSTDEEGDHQVEIEELVSKFEVPPPIVPGLYMYAIVSGLVVAAYLIYNKSRNNNPLSTTFSNTF